ncbi:MAG: hypothetical protein M1835_002206, partial [Candelina submexicana]
MSKTNRPPTGLTFGQVVEYYIEQLKADPELALNHLWTSLLARNFNVEFCVQRILTTLSATDQLHHVRCILQIALSRRERSSELLAAAWDWYEERELYKRIETANQSKKAILLEMGENVRTISAMVKEVTDNRTSTNTALRSICELWGVTTVIPAEYRPNPMGVTFTKKLCRFAKLCTYEMAWGVDGTPGLLSEIIARRLRSKAWVRSTCVNIADIDEASAIIRERADSAQSSRGNSKAGGTGSSPQRVTAEHGRGGKVTTKPASKAHPLSTGINKADIDSQRNSAITRRGHFKGSMITKSPITARDLQLNKPPLVRKGPEEARGPASDTIHYTSKRLTLEEQYRLERQAVSNAANAAPTQKVCDLRFEPSVAGSVEDSGRLLQDDDDDEEENQRSGDGGQGNHHDKASTSTEAGKKDTDAKQELTTVTATSSPNKRQLSSSLSTKATTIPVQRFTRVYNTTPKFFSSRIRISHVAWLQAREEPGFRCLEDTPTTHRYAILDDLLTRKEIVVGLENEIEAFTRVLGERYSIVDRGKEGSNVPNMCYPLFQQMIRQDPLLYGTFVCVLENPEENWKMVSIPATPRVRPYDPDHSLALFSPRGTQMHSPSTWSDVFFDVAAYGEVWIFPFDHMIVDGNTETGATATKDILPELTLNHARRTLPVIEHAGRAHPPDPNILDAPFTPTVQFPVCSAIGMALTGMAAWEDAAVIHEVNQLFSDDGRVVATYVYGVRKRMVEAYIDCYERFRQAYRA